MCFATTTSSSLRRLAVGTAIGGLLVAIASCSDQGAWSWKPVSWDEPLPFPESPQAIASQAVAIDIEQLRPPSNKRISVSLPGGGSITATLTEFKEIGEKQFIWRGAIEGEPGGVVKFSVFNDTLVGEIIAASGKMYRIRHLKKGVVLIEELDPARFPHEDVRRLQELKVFPDRLEPNPATGRIDPISFHLSQDETTLIDLMVFYTAGVVGVEGNQEAVLGRINGLIDDTNTTYENSKVKQRVRLAHAEQTAYVESGDLYLDWIALKDSVGSLNGVSTQRNSHSADIVVLLTKDEPETGSCGQADQMHEESQASCNDAFAVVPLNCATMTYSFAHEVGHVMGADHNNETTIFNPPFLYSRGYLAPSNSWRTIMAYETESCVLPACQRIPHWSNPSVKYAEKGARRERTGSDDEVAPANNAKSLNETADTVAKFSDQCASPPAPSA